MSSKYTPSVLVRERSSKSPRKCRTVLLVLHTPQDSSSRHSEIRRSDSDRFERRPLSAQRFSSLIVTVYCACVTKRSVECPVLPQCRCNEVSTCGDLTAALLACRPTSWPQGTRRSVKTGLLPQRPSAIATGEHTDHQESMHANVPDPVDLLPVNMAPSGNPVHPSQAGGRADAHHYWQAPKLPGTSTQHPSRKHMGGSVRLPHH